MKRKLFSLFMVLAVSVTVLAGCANTNKPSQDEYVNEDVVAFVESREAAVDYMSYSSGDDMDIMLRAEGDAVVFIFQNNLELSQEEQREQVEEMKSAYLSENGTFFQQALEELRQESSEDAYIIVRYLAADGTELVSHEIK